MAKKESTTKPAVRGRSAQFTVERAFFIFAGLLFPLYVLLIHKGEDVQGTISDVLLGVYALAVGVMAFVMLALFVIKLAKHADTHSQKFGELLIAYLLYAAAPLVVLKVVAFTVWQLLPTSHAGMPEVLCDLYTFIRSLYFMFDIQTVLTYSLIGSFVLFGTMAVLSVWRQPAKS